MERMLSEMEAQLESAILEINREKNIVLRYDRSVKRVQANIDELKAYIQIHPFPGMAEEIIYFKELAPRFYSRLFYFMKLYQLESYRQFASRDQFMQALREELQGIEQFFAKHEDISRYYYQRTSHWDEQLFTRRSRLEWPTNDIGVVLDADLCLGSYWVSWIKANERYRAWLEEEFKLLSGGGEESRVIKKHATLCWVSSQTDLVELINGMHLAGSFGEVPLKQVVNWFEEAFEIDLGHFYVTFQEIARRKKSRTKYIDLVKERLVRKIEEMG